MQAVDSHEKTTTHCDYKHCVSQGRCFIVTGEKPFQCPECGRRFARSTDLKVHMPVHSEDKPYKCGECEKMFTRFSTLKEHIRTHTGELVWRKSAIFTASFFVCLSVCAHYLDWVGAIAGGKRINNRASKLLVVGTRLRLFALIYEFSRVAIGKIEIHLMFTCSEAIFSFLTPRVFIIAPKNHQLFFFFRWEAFQVQRM